MLIGNSDQVFSNTVQDILDTYFNSKIEMHEAAEKAIILDALIDVLKKTKLINDIAIKGGANLQRIYQSLRFTALVSNI